MNRKKTAIFLVILSLILFMAFGYNYVKDKFLYDLVVKAARIYFKKNYSADFYTQKISGNIVSGLCFENVEIRNIRGLPQAYARAGEVGLTYSLPGVLKRKIGIYIKRLEFTYGSSTFPVKFFHYGRIAILQMDERVVGMAEFKRLLQAYNAFPGASAPGGGEDIFLEGVASIKGYAIFDNFKPNLFFAQLDSGKIRLCYKDILRTQFGFLVNVKSGPDFSYFDLTGSLDVDEAEYAGELPGRAFKSNFNYGIFNSANINLSARGGGIRVINRNLDVLAGFDLRLKKYPIQPAFLLGKISSQAGSYIFRDKKFKIHPSEIIFEGPIPVGPSLNITGSSRISRYMVTVTLSGTAASPRLQISSVPDLPKSEIKALLLFGKRLDKLDIYQKESVYKDMDVAGALLSAVFFGRVEKEIADFIGVDDISLHPKVSEVGRLSAPSLEVGKYFAGSYLYGTYKIGGEDKTNRVQQAIAGEVSLTDSLSFKGERHFNETITLPQEDRLSLEIKLKW